MALEPIGRAVAQLPAGWRMEADHLEPFAPAAAEAFRRAALALEGALRAELDAVLTLREAARRSGLSVDRVRHKVASGEIPNVGRKHAPRVRAGDLPTKARRPAAPVLYDEDADARQLLASGGT